MDIFPQPENEDRSSLTVKLSRESHNKLRMLAIALDQRMDQLVEKLILWAWTQESNRIPVTSKMKRRIKRLLKRNPSPL